MAEIIWTEMAINDLYNIADYISKDSLYYANDFIQRIIKQVERLQLFPKMGRIVPEVNDENIREIIYHNYRLVYKIKYLLLLYHMEVMIYLKGLKQCDFNLYQHKFKSYSIHGFANFRISLLWI